MRTLPLMVFVVAIFAGTIGNRVTAAQAAPQQPAAKGQPQTAEQKSGNPLTDGWITMKIHSQMVTENALEDSDIDVDTNARVVTLSGTVASEAGRMRAVAIAKGTDGVSNVVDKLRVAATSAGTTGRDAAAGATTATRKVNDGWITSKIYSQFLPESALEDSDIDVDVTKGVVTLSGTVRSAGGRERAVAIAKATDGVKSVKDSLKVSAQAR